MKNDVQFGIRMPAELRDEWNKTCEEAGQDSAAIARELFRAAIRYHSRNGNLYPPFELVPSPRTPEEHTTYTVTANGGVAIAGDNNHVRVSKKGNKK